MINGRVKDFSIMKKIGGEKLTAENFIISFSYDK